jgi:hypothetical protein
MTRSVFVRGLCSSLLFAQTTLAPPRDTPAPSPPRETPTVQSAWMNTRLLEHATPIADYTLRAKLDPVAHTVHGEGTITWRNRSTAGIDELWIHLYLNAFKNQSSVFLREPVGGFRGSTMPADWGTIDVRKLTWHDGSETRELWPQAELHRLNDDDETDARVPLPRAVQPGETMTLDVVWDDKLPSVVERTGYDGTFHMVAQWFPKLAKHEPDGTFAHFPFHHLGEFYADYGTYDVTLDVPANFEVGATGAVVESNVEHGRRIERHVQEDVHDFAWTAWDQFRSRKETIDGVACTILYPRGYESQAERELATMRFALPHYGSLYGRYPYSVLTMVHPPASAPEAGGMEYPTFITTGGASYMPAGIHDVELVTIHEFGHQYFYGLIASHETKWPFLDEGLNSYAEAEAMKAWLGPGSAADILGLRVDDAEAHATQAKRFVHGDRVAQPAYEFTSGAAYGALVYSRSTAIFETRRRVYGTDAIERALGTYARRFRFKHPVPNDLIDTFAQEMGKGPAELLHTALFDKGWVDFKVDAAQSHAVRAPAGLFDVGGKRETVAASHDTQGPYTGWALVRKDGTLNLPVEIELLAEDGTKTRVPWDGVSDYFRAPYTGRSPLRTVTVDPDRRILLDQDPSNDVAAARGHTGGGAPRVLERSTYWAELLLGILSP